jgi:histidyl-tRNA synthetase
MEKIKTLRGFKDIFGEEVEKFKGIEDVARKYLKLLGFREIELPILEKTELFVRSIGDTTDIVEKEMFTFIDRGGDSLTLRPEATAGVVRHYLQESLYAKERVAKLFTMGPMFRHERPQKGRFREFHQIDVEVFGVEEALVDAELVWMIFLILGDLGVKNYTIEVNSVGCKQCREPFRDVLVEYFETEKGLLCEDCLRRLSRNPLRIFDCKNAQCIQIAANSPLLYDNLCGSCKNHLDTFLRYMDDYGVAVKIDKRLVRGLDYYTKTVFEITSEDLGAQKAFMAGGRYNNLVEEMGGPATAGIGFAIGVERLAMLTHLQDMPVKPTCFFASVGERAKGCLIPILRAFAAEGLTVRYSYEGKSLKAQMRYADNVSADFVLILGDEEIEKGIIILRNMKDKKQYELLLDPQNILLEFKKIYSHFFDI